MKYEITSSSGIQGLSLADVGGEEKDIAEILLSIG